MSNLLAVLEIHVAIQSELQIVSISVIAIMLDRKSFLCNKEINDVCVKEAVNTQDPQKPVMERYG